MRSAVVFVRRVAAVVTRRPVAKRAAVVSAGTLAVAMLPTRPPGTASLAALSPHKAVLQLEGLLAPAATPADGAWFLQQRFKSQADSPGQTLDLILKAVAAIRGAQAADGSISEAAALQALGSLGFNLKNRHTRRMLQLFLHSFAHAQPHLSAPASAEAAAAAASAGKAQAAPTTIDAEQLACAVAFLHPRDALNGEQRARVLFALTDLDRCGSITLEDLRRVLLSLFMAEHRSTGRDRATVQEVLWRQAPLLRDVPLELCFRVIANEAAQRILSDADADRDARISEQEFVRFMAQSKHPDVRYLDSHFAQMLPSRLVDPPHVELK